MSNQPGKWKGSESGNRSNNGSRGMNHNVPQYPLAMPFVGPSLASPFIMPSQFSHSQTRPQPLASPMEGLFQVPFSASPTLPMIGYFPFFPSPQQLPMNGPFHFSYPPPQLGNQVATTHQNVIPSRQQVERQCQSPTYLVSPQCSPMDQEMEDSYHMNQSNPAQTDGKQQVLSAESDTNNAEESIIKGERGKVLCQPTFYYIIGPQDEIIVCDEKGVEIPSQNGESTVIIVQTTSSQEVISNVAMDGDKMSVADKNQGFSHIVRKMDEKKVEDVVVKKNEHVVNNAKITDEIEIFVETPLTQIAELVTQTFKLLYDPNEFKHFACECSMNVKNCEVPMETAGTLLTKTETKLV